MSNFEKNELRDQIRMLEKSARSLEPDAARRQEWNNESTRFASDFIESLPAGKAFQSFGSLKGSLELHLESEPAQTMAECLEELRHGVLSKGLNPASGGHLGYIPGGGIYGGVLGDYLAALTNQYAGIFFGGPGAVKIENELIRWLCRLFGFPATSHGNLASGGSIANLIALVTAREARHIQSADIPRLCIYLTGQVHHCIHKAIRISGLGESQVRTIPTDSAYRMDPQALQRQIRQDADAGLQPFLVVASAGTTDTGAIDPLDRIADIAEASGLWFHVDAAYGGFFILCEDPETTGDYRDALKGIERSDSLVVDPHKGLFLSYGLGAVLIKDVAAQYRAHYYRAAYMQDTLSSQEEWSPCDLSPELTKHFRGLRLWLPLKLHGLEPFKASLAEKILLCRYFYEEVAKLGFETGPYPETSVCIYRFVPESGDANTFNQRIVESIIKDGSVFVSSTTIQDVYWIRIAILSFRTHIDTINRYLDLLKVALEELNYGKNT